MCLPMRSFLALLTLKASTYAPQKYIPTTLEEILWRSPTQPYGNCHSAKNAGVIGLKSNGGEHRTYNLRSTYTTGRKES